MSYSKHTWTNGETITQELLNNIECGIYNNDTSIQKLINSKATANGIATLDSNGKIPVSQLPNEALQGGSSSGDSGGDSTTTGDYIPTTEKGVANGVATLGSDGKIPTSQLPDEALQNSNSGSGTSETPVKKTIAASASNTVWSSSRLIVQGKFTLMLLDITFQQALASTTTTTVATFDSSLAPSTNICQNTISNNGISIYIVVTTDGEIQVKPLTKLSYNDGIRATIPLFVGM